MIGKDTYEHDKIAFWYVMLENEIYIWIDL